MDDQVESRPTLIEEQVEAAADVEAVVEQLENGDQGELIQQVVRRHPVDHDQCDATQHRLQEVEPV